MKRRYLVAACAASFWLASPGQALDAQSLAVVINDADANSQAVGEYYAQRTLLKLEVLPEHVADAVFVLTSGNLTRTTGLNIPVDAGVAAAFLR